VNPIAGIGGAAGMAGSDGAVVQRAAAERGGISHAAERAIEVLRSLAEQFTEHDAVLIVAPGRMGEEAASVAGIPCRAVNVATADPTSAADTVACAEAFADAEVDLLLFAGGDGTAADVARGCADRIPVLGIPSGVKMYSGCFAVNTRAAADIAGRVLAGGVVATTGVEVVDLDEVALRSGRVAPRLTAALRVPVAPAVQSRKAPTSANVAGQVQAVAAAAAALLTDGTVTALGPGGTTHAVLDRLGLDGTLLGVDIVCGGRLLASNVNEVELYEWARKAPLRVMVSVIGGQGFVFGRGNQQFSPRVIRAAGAADIVILAPESKLAALQGRPLLADTGDAALDAELAGYRRVLTGAGQWAVYPLGQRLSSTI
jgi:predicted polyphosphate/ATP-dependent NAD kinase